VDRFVRGRRPSRFSRLQCPYTETLDRHAVFFADRHKESSTVSTSLFLIDVHGVYLEDILKVKDKNFRYMYIKANFYVFDKFELYNITF